MITLFSSDSLSGAATLSSSSVTYTIMYMEAGRQIPSYGDFMNAQGQLATSPATLLSAGISVETLIRDIYFVNTSAADESVRLFIDGTTGAHQFAKFTVVAGGSAQLTSDGVKAYDSLGHLITTSAITLTGDVTGSGSGSVASTIAANAVDNTKAADMAQATIKGRASGAGTGDPQDLTAAQVLTITGAAVAARNINTTAPLTGGGDLSADRTLAISPAVAGVSAGSLAAADKTKIDALGTASTKNVGNTVLDPGTGKLEFAIPSAGLVTGASKTYASTDRGYVYRRSNSGSAMSDTLPALTNTTADIGWTIGIYNEDTTVAAVLTVNASGGALFRSATGTTSSTSPINYGSRQQYIWDGTQWLLYAGNANLLRRSGSIVAGNFPSFVDTAGNAVVDSGVSAATVSGKVASARLINTTAPLTGGGDLSADRTLALTTSPAGQTPVGTTRTISTTAPITGGGDLSADRTFAISPASTSAAGSQSALDKKKEDNLWYDVTANSISTMVGDDSTDNLAAWNTLFAALPTGATVYFPVGTYRFSGDIPITADKHLTIKGAGKYASIIKTTSLTANGFNISGGQYWYNTFSDLRFETTSLAKTAGAAILISTVGLSSSAQQVGINVSRCSFSNWFKAIYCLGDNVGQGPGNLSVWDSLDISITGGSGGGTGGGPANSRGLHISGGGTNLVCSNSTINMGFPPFHITGSACIEINTSGAIQLIGGEFIGGTNTILLNANFGGTSSIAAVYADNCFFDQSAGSTFKITGANVVNRCKFDECGITSGNIAGSIAVEIASSGTGAAGTATAAADGINFFDCDIYPNGAGTGNGFLITGAQGVSIQSSRISGWTNGVQVTPAVSNGYTKITLSGNKMGATNNFTTPNTVGLLLNAGSFQYGVISVDDSNDFSGSTTPISDSSTIGPTGIKDLPHGGGITNVGSIPALASGGATLLVNNGRGVATSGTTETFLATFRIGANAVQVGDIIQVTLLAQSTSTGTFIGRLRVGTGGTIADALINTNTNTSAAGAAGSWVILDYYVYVVALGATGTVWGAITGTGGAVPGVLQGATLAEAPANVPTTAAWFITVAATASVAGYTVRQLRARVL